MKKIIDPKVILLVAIIAVFPVFCFAARDLTAAANTAVSEATSIGKAAGCLGVLSGAIIYQIPGAAQFAQRVMIGGAIGAALSFAAPSLLNLFHTIFGG